jgi:hypothetical protein
VDCSDDPWTCCSARRDVSPGTDALHYADLAPIQFYDRELFPWLPELEARSDAIRDELVQVLASGPISGRTFSTRRGRR